MLAPLSTDEMPPTGYGGSPGLSPLNALHPGVTAVGLTPKPGKLIPAAGNHVQASAKLAGARHAGCGLHSPPLSPCPLWKQAVCTCPQMCARVAAWGGGGDSVGYGALHKAGLLASVPRWQAGPVRAPQHRSLSSSLTPMPYGVTECCLLVGPSSIFRLTTADRTLPQPSSS